MSSLLLNGLELNSGPYLLGDFDSGNGQVITATVESVLFDGDVVSGSRTGNRTITLPVVIQATSATDRAAKLNALYRLVDLPKFTLTFTPDDGLPVTWDCYRGQVDVQRNLKRERQRIMVCTITIPAAPFGRSPSPISMTTTMSGNDPSGVILDQCDSLTTTGPGSTPASVAVNRPGCSIDTAFFVTATGSVRYDQTSPNSSGQDLVSLPVGRNSGSWDFSSYQYLNFAAAGTAMLSNIPNVNVGYDGNCFLALRDSGGRLANYYLSRNPDQSFYRYSINLNNPTFKNPGFDRSSIVAYFLQASRNGTGADGATWTYKLWLDDLHGSQTGSSATARILRLLRPPGTARTPLEVQINLPNSAASSMLIAPYAGQPLSFFPVASNTTMNGQNFSLTLGAANYRPGAFSIYARVLATVQTTVSVVAAARTTSRSVTTVLPAASDTRIVYLGELVLPPSNPIDQASTSTFTLAITSTATITIYEVFTVPVDSEGVIHALAAVQEGIQTYVAPANGVIVIPGPDVVGQRGLFAGTSRAQAVAADDSVAAFTGGGLYLPQADYTDILLAVESGANDGTGALVTTVTTSCYPRWHTEREV